MILSLTIRNIALIQELDIVFHRGLQVLAGETGAGKSIVVDAVNLALGGRADRGLIRSGCEKASVEAVFDVAGNIRIAGVMERENIDYDGREVTVYREITASGKNICRICGVMLPLTVLKELSGELMDIHGQHEHRFLMDPLQHLRFLDRMGGEEHRALLRRTEADCDAFLNVHRAYARLRKENERKQERIAILEKDLKELHAASLRKGEEETLTEECLRLRNSEKIAAALREARELLSRGEQETSTLEKTREAAGLLASVGEYGERIRKVAERCQSLYYELQEVVYDVSDLTDQSESDPARLEKAESRMDLIRRLERKYGPTVEAVLEEQKKLEQEYGHLCGLDDRMAETAREHKRLLTVYRTSARELSEARKRLAGIFEENMRGELAALGMEKTEFRVVFSAKNDDKPLMPRSTGDDDLEFMIAPNPGEPLKPMARIASGGELSRLMLAIKALEADTSGVDAMVFDEIDTGISGRMAQAVAEKMIRISRKRQVICVTHLPQIAAAADYQFKVEKKVEEGRTFTGVRELDHPGRIGEIARMVGGAEGSAENAEDYAAALLDAAMRVRKEKTPGPKKIFAKDN